jgi:fumarate reductase subunit C
LAFAAYHTITWFALTPKAMPLMARGRPVSPWLIVSAHYAVWAVISVTVVIAAVV